ncbi:MAG: hypothetical protein LUD25_05405 [Coriobacteriaceae bacterium]|nr:hypothetical protein [Coriobacteriaceae bacterium]
MNKYNIGAAMEIGGKVYEMDLGNAEARRVFRDSMEKLAEKMDAEAMRPILREGVDALMGDGSFDKIFKRLVPSDANMVRLMTYMTHEIQAWQQETEIIRAEYKK